MHSLDTLLVLIFGVKQSPQIDLFAAYAQCTGCVVWAPKPLTSASGTEALFQTNEVWTFHQAVCLAQSSQKCSLACRLFPLKWLLHSSFAQFIERNHLENIKMRKSLRSKRQRDASQSRAPEKHCLLVFRLNLRISEARRWPECKPQKAPDSRVSIRDPV